MQVFIVYRQGVYMQGIVGVFNAKETAEAAAKSAKVKERDDYHDFYIAPVVLNTEYSVEDYEDCWYKGEWKIK